MASFKWPPQGGGGVTTINGESGDVTLVGGTGITVTPAGQNITISAINLGTVTSVSVVSANGFAGTVTNPTSTPAITLSTTLTTPVIAGNGTALIAATTTGTGSTVVLATSPTLITPALGTPTAAVLTFATGLPLTTGVTGTLPIANGGTNAITAAAAYNNLSPMTTTGDIEYEASANTAARLPIGSTGNVLTVSGGIPAWAPPATSGTVTSVSVVSANGFAGTVATATSTPAITLSTTVTGILSGDGTTISAASTTGSGAVVLATSPTLVTPALGTPTALVGTNITGTGSSFTAGNINASTNSTLTTLSALSLPVSQLTGILPIANGGTDNGSLAVTAGGVIYTDGTKFQNVGAGTSGLFLQSAGASPPIWAAAGTTAMLTKAISYTLLSTDDTVIFTAVATATLPTAVGINGKKFIIINGSTSAANITIATTSSQTIGGRASSDIILTQYWDTITVESDGTNFQICDKMETTFSSTTGGKTITSASGAFQGSSPSLTLGVGKWRIRSNFHYAPGTSSSFSIGPQSGCFAADGADNATPPTTLTGTLGATAFSAVSPGGYFPYLGFTAGTNTGVQTPFIDFMLYVTSGTKVVHSVIFVNYTAASGTLTYENYLEANRIW